MLIIDTRFFGVAICIIQAQVWCFQYTQRAYHRHSLLTTFLYFFKIFASGGLIVSLVYLLWFHGLQPTDSSVHGICQARILESIDISFSIKIFTTIILVQSIFNCGERYRSTQMIQVFRKKSFRTKSSRFTYTALYVCTQNIQRISSTSRCIFFNPLEIILIFLTDMKSFTLILSIISF